MNNTKIPGFDLIIKFIPFLWRNQTFRLRLMIICALLLIPITIAMQLGLPVILRDIINQLNDKFNSSEKVVLLLIFAYGFFWTLSTITQKLREIVFYKPIGHAITDYSLTVFKHLHTLSLKFHLGRQTGKITSAIDKSQLAIAMVITNVFFRIAPLIIEILFMFVIIGYLYGLFYAGLLIITVLVFTLWGFIAFNLVSKVQRAWNEVDGRSTARFVDGLLNIETVKYFNRHDHEIAISRQLNQLLGVFAVKAQSTFTFVQMVYGLIIAVGLGFSTYFSAMAVLNGFFTLGDFILINSYIMLFLGPLYQLTGHIYNTMYNLRRMEPAAELLQEEHGVEQKNILPELIVHKGEIKFENVGFEYLTEVPLIKNLTFTVPAGNTIAIVGPSGCGKSTIARLLLRLFDPTSGKILIDNQDIQTCDRNSVRKYIACVPQDIALFNNTLRYNLCYGVFNCSDEDLETIIKLTMLYDFIQILPQGLNTMVGERGLKLSGGERQRIALARALLKHAPILVLDEATSSLDVKTEQNIQDNILNAAKQTTSVIIAHRLSTIVSADQILVMDKGSIVESGTHTQLLYENGLYAKLWQQQRNKETGRGI